MPIYDYKCTKCGDVEEHYHSNYNSARLAAYICDKCNSVKQMIISTPHINLEGISGDFPTASERWAKKHENYAKQKAKGRIYCC